MADHFSDRNSTFVLISLVAAIEQLEEIVARPLRVKDEVVGLLPGSSSGRSAAALDTCSEVKCVTVAKVQDDAVRSHLDV